MYTDSRGIVSQLGGSLTPRGGVNISLRIGLGASAYGLASWCDSRILIDIVSVLTNNKTCLTSLTCAIMLFLN